MIALKTILALLYLYELNRSNKYMKITLCGSIQFIEQMKEAKTILEAQGHEVLLPTSAETGQTKEWWNALRIENPTEFLKIKADRMMGHFQKIESSDAILVMNYDKSGIENYIGGNTLMEMGFAFHLGKKIFLLNSIPEKLSYEEEVFGMNPLVLGGDLSLI